MTTFIKISPLIVSGTKRYRHVKADTNTLWLLSAKLRTPIKVDPHNGTHIDIAERQTNIVRGIVIEYGAKERE
jgi:hypothetical protein